MNVQAANAAKIIYCFNLLPIYFLKKEKFTFHFLRTSGNFFYSE